MGVLTAEALLSRENIQLFGFTTLERSADPGAGAGDDDDFQHFPHSSASQTSPLRNCICFA